jgi:N,N'-diacetyllegionaminate synthase
MSRNHITIIAEAGVNHNGSMDLARKLVDAAAEAGADAVKFQAFKAETLVSVHAPKAEYQKQGRNDPQSQQQMLKALELSHAEQKELLRYTRDRGIEFLSSPFDMESVEFLADLGLSAVKVPSGEITNLPYLRAIARHPWQVILSTGMSFFEEVEAAVRVLETCGKAKEDMVLLQCNTQYPTPVADVNLRAMPAMGRALGLAFGYSDHTCGIEVAGAAAAMGAVVIEKHFTLDKAMAGPDHRASLDPGELKAMVAAIRNIEQALGTREKSPSPSETANRAVARKSIVAGRPIKKGETFSEENLVAKRPGTGISPMAWDEVMGRKAARDFGADEMIEL